LPEESIEAKNLPKVLEQWGEGIMPAPTDPIKNALWRKRISESETGDRHHMFGKHHSDATKQKISNSLKGNKISVGRVLSDETKRKISDSERGKIISDASRKKMSDSKKGEKNANFGKHLSDERKKEIGDSHRGTHHSDATKQKMSEDRKGIPGFWKGKHHSDATKEKLSRALKGRIVSEATRKKKSNSVKGEKCYNWQGGISFFPYCPKFNKELKKNIRNFFGNNCIVCGKTPEENGRCMDVHHVFSEKMTCCENKIEEMDEVRKKLPKDIARFGEEEFSPLEIVHIRMMVPLCSSCHGKQNENQESLPYEETKYKKIFVELILTKYGGKCYSEKGV
jgi:hypothetical protein